MQTFLGYTQCLSFMANVSNRNIQSYPILITERRVSEYSRRACMMGLFFKSNKSLLLRNIHCSRDRVQRVSYFMSRGPCLSSYINCEFYCVSL